MIPLVALLGLGTACAPTAPFVWASDVHAQPEETAASPGPIRAGDTLTVVVEGHDNMSGTPVVSTTGFIVVPTVGPILVLARTPEEVKVDLTKRLSASLENPQVSVVIAARRLQISVLGEVKAPGKYLADPSDGVANALALAGGLTEFADDDSIFLVRGSQTRVRFRMTDLTSGKTPVRLLDHDLIVVE
ncbi:MAG TPA: polysaccharide biosynthesis/export family protein [Polyangiaceae bacterium]|nr:polysaccharide biosynthesis/export family protein [Polyangiaceae bacterium]